MIAQGLDYAVPASLDEACALLTDDPATTRLLAGGTWVVPELGRGEDRAVRIVDLRRAGLADIRVEDDVVWIGAMTTYADLLASPIVRTHLPLLALMAAQVTGGPQIANQGTIGGSAAAARVSSDAPAAIVALDATAVLAHAGGRRRLPIHELLVGHQETTIAPGEVLAGFEFAAAPAPASGYCKLKRRASSWPIATAAATVTVDAAGIATVGFAVGGVTPAPVRLRLAPQPAAELSAATVLAEVGAAVEQAVRTPYADVLATAEHRRAIAPVAAQRAVAAALAEL